MSEKSSERGFEFDEHIKEVEQLFRQMEKQS